MGGGQEVKQRAKTPSVNVGDFNEDGHLDLAVANGNSDNVSIIFGFGNGTFRFPINYDADDGPNSITTGDFDENGYTDLAVSNGNSDSLSIFLGVGGGIFDSAVNYKTGNSPISVYPNPFNPITNIKFSIPEASHINITVYDVIGRKTKVLVDSDLNEDEYIITWDGKNSDGEHAESGVYFVRMTATGFAATRKMILLRYVIKD
ncbi:MAG: T9SS type A sorting domain-containing protein [Candidatus Krumholzibacteriota bacterium]|nr:T9SS type A sorting domain-containing protein [Candidatus Krumholzibacteriota bacterium]